MKLVTLKRLRPKYQTVLVRVDFNVVEQARVIDEFRIQATVPTLNYLLKRNCALVLISHNGRPEGKRARDLSLAPVIPYLSRLLDRPVGFASDCVGTPAQAATTILRPGQVVLLENLRFHKEEEANDPAFGRALASLGEVYVDDAFAAIHRAHASIVGVPKFLPHAAGLLVEHEYNTLSSLLTKPKQPFIAIIGGVKVSDKLAVLQNLLKLVDTLVIGGAMANTFLAAQGYHMGKSVVEKSCQTAARQVLARAKSNGVKIILPTDLVVATSATPQARSRIVAASACPLDSMALDLGPATTASIIDEVKTSKTVFWNGPLGLAEITAFAHASYQVAQAIAGTKTRSVVGGGDTSAFLDKYRMLNKFDFVSTGGGATLEFLADKKLPGLEVLTK